MKQLFTPIIALICATLFSIGVHAANERALDLDALLKQLEQGQFAQKQENAQREKEFVAQRTQQDSVLRETRTQRDNALDLSEKLETQFEENEFLSLIHI